MTKGEKKRPNYVSQCTSAFWTCMKNIKSRRTQSKGPFSSEKQSRRRAVRSALRVPPQWRGLALSCTLTPAATRFQTQLDFYGWSAQPGRSLLIQTHQRLCPRSVCGVSAFEFLFSPLTSLIHPSFLPPAPRYCQPSKYFALGITCFVIWFLHSRISMYI